MPISLAAFKERLVRAVSLAKTSPDHPEMPGVVLISTPAFCDTPLKIAVFTLSLHVEGFRDLHTHEQVQLANEALAAGYVRQEVHQ